MIIVSVVLSKERKKTGSLLNGFFLFFWIFGKIYLTGDFSMYNDREIYFNELYGSILFDDLSRCGWIGM